MVPLRQLTCLPGIRSRPPIHHQIPLSWSQADGYDARCAGTRPIPHSTPHAETLCAFQSRQELATREHMLDHGQLGPSTPALPSLSPAASRRPSNDFLPAARSRRPSTSLNVTISRRPSVSQPRSRLNSVSNGTAEARPAALAALSGRRLLESLSMSALETEDDPDESDVDKPRNGTAAAPGPHPRRLSGSDARLFRPSPLSMEGIGRDLSHALEESMAGDAAASPPEEPAHPTPPRPTDAPKRAPSPPPGGTPYASGADLAAQLSSNPKLAALRAAASLTMTGLNGSRAALSPPILINPKCSGYFVEPVCPSYLHRALIITMCLDEVDGARARKRRARWQDPLSEQEVRRQDWQLRLGGRMLWM